MRVIAVRVTQDSLEEGRVVLMTRVNAACETRLATRGMCVVESLENKQYEFRLRTDEFLGCWVVFVLHAS